tara:strand:- start:123 stop:401 length:279 start_codon:yes stop_codon:yes gene_type:complete
MLDSFLTNLYVFSQAIIFILYVPVLLTVWRSPRAEAINVPAQFAFFVIGFIAALYMYFVNGDKLATLIICGHILIGNLLQALMALYKQKKYN